MSEEMVAWLNFAIRLEEKGKALYEKALGVVHHQRAKQLFDYLVVAETKHKEYLIKMRDGVAAGNTAEVKEGMAGFGEADQSQIFNPEDFKEVLDGSAAVTEMFNLAIKGERMSIELYLDLSEKQEDKEMKEFFRKLATEELGHKKSLESMGMDVFGMDLSSDDDEESIDDYKAKPLKEIELKMESVKYNPEAIEVDEGDKVVLKMRAMDTGYGIVCPTFGIKEFLPKGELVIEEVYPDHPGEFEFFNDVPAGEGWRDMKGKLVVKETELGKKKRERKGDDGLL